MKTIASLRIPVLVSCLTVTLASCSEGDLEDKDNYATQVTTGLGPKGVTRPQGTGQAPPTPPGGGLSPACADIQTRIFQTRCAGAACHGEPGSPSAAYSDFVTPVDLAAAVRDVPAKANCGTYKLVDTQNPANSALLRVITQTPQPCVSLQMPVGDPLSAEDAACMAEWVNAAASGAI